MRFQHPKYGQPVQTWPYHDADGNLCGYECRFEFKTAEGSIGKKYLPVTFCDIGGGRKAWRAKGIPAPRPLHNVPEILARPDAPVLVCEGPKAASAAKNMFPDYVVTTSMGGAQSPKKTDWTPLRNRNVVGWPDNDDAGQEYIATVINLACNPARPQ
jgi:hypothetical protein